MHSKSLQPYPTLGEPMDSSPPGSSAHGVSQERILEQLTFPPPGDLPEPGIKLASLEFPELAGGFFTTMSPGKPQSDSSYCLSFLHNSFHKTDLLLLQNVKAFYVSYVFILQ